MKLRLTGWCFVLALMAPALMAQETEVPDYLVEIIVVRHLNPVSGTERWPVSQDPLNPEMAAQRFPRAESTDLKLTAMVPKLANSKNFRVISHTGWIQPGYTREDARRKIFRRNTSTGESISGEFVLSRERYLRLQIDLQFTVDGEIYQMRSKRRMLSRKTHYIDHPHFGVIALITPL